MARSLNRALGALALLVTAGAGAQTRPLEEVLSVARADDCLMSEPLVEHLRVWLGRDEVDARVSVVVEEEGEGASFVVLHAGEPRAARRFDRLPASCPDRRAALALAIALAIDAAVLDDLLPREEEGDGGGIDPATTAAPSVAEAPPPTIPEPPFLHARGPRLHLEVAVEAQMLIEVLPEVAAAWQVGVRAVFDDVFEIGAHAWITSVSGAELEPGRVDAQLAGGRLDVCIRRAGEVTIRSCLGIAAGVGRGQGRDVDNAREATVPFGGLFGRLGLALALTEWIAIEVAADAWLAFVRPRFDLLSADGSVFRSVTLPLGGAVGSLGVAVRF